LRRHPFHRPTFPPGGSDAPGSRFRFSRSAAIIWASRDPRCDVLLMTKAHSPRDRSAESARAHLEGSLQRLGTDYVDLWQLHSVTSPEDVDAAFRPGGAMEYIFEARERGLVRYVWSLPISVTVVGMERPKLVRINAAVARSGASMDESERAALRQRILPRADPRLEWYKQGQKGTARP